MASSFDRWEKDPFFSPAEEIQDSADRMVSTYRTWLHATKDTSSKWNCDELQRDLLTTLGTTKWQLDEFKRAIKSSYIKTSNEDARNRHRDFIIAIEEQISKIENSLQQSALSEGKRSHSWVCLDEGECDELALFLSGPPEYEELTNTINIRVNNENPQEKRKEPSPDCANKVRKSTEWGYIETRKEKSHGHRRTASASADISFLKITISGGDLQQVSLDGESQKGVRKIPSVSGFLNTVESASKFKWPKNGFRKLQAIERQEEADSALFLPPQLTKGMNTCYERSKSCLDGSDNCYDKHLYGWYGAIQRLIQRLHYQMQQSRRSAQLLFMLVLILLIVFVARHLV